MALDPEEMLMEAGPKDALVTSPHGAAVFEGIHLTMAQHIESFVLPALKVAPGEPLDIAYNLDTPLSALQKILAATDRAPVYVSYERRHKDETIYGVIDKRGNWYRIDEATSRELERAAWNNTFDEVAERIAKERDYVPDRRRGEG